MSKASVTYEEIRFDLRDEQVTQVYVLCRAEGDCPISVQGWHHKTFPARQNVQQFMKLWEDGTEDPVLWPLNAPVRI